MKKLTALRMLFSGRGGKERQDIDALIGGAIATGADASQPVTVEPLDDTALREMDILEPFPADVFFEPLLVEVEAVPNPRRKQP